MKIRLKDDTTEPVVTFRLFSLNGEIYLAAEEGGRSWHVAKVFVKDGKIIMKRACDLPIDIFHTTSVSHYIALEPNVE